MPRIVAVVLTQARQTIAFLDAFFMRLHALRADVPAYERATWPQAAAPAPAAASAK